MKILLLTKYFPPEIGTASHIFHELAIELLKKGHLVTVGTTFPWYNLSVVPQKYKNRTFLMEELDGINIVRFASLPLPEGRLKYGLGHFIVPPSILISGLLAGPHDIIYVYSPPLIMAAVALILGKIWKKPTVMGVQDLHPQCLIDLGAIKNPIIIRILENIEHFSYKNMTAITVHSQGNKDFIVKKQISEDKIFVLENWIDTDLVRPLPRNNEFSQKYGLNHKFVVSYAGTLGISNSSMTMIKVAEILKEYENILFLIVGDGVDKADLIKEHENKNLNNVIFLPMQPKEVYPWILASSDASLVLLGKDVVTPVVPSKMLNIMAARRPVIGSMNLSGDGPILINKANAGYCVGPEDADGLADAILKLYDNPKLLGEFGLRGREYAERHFSAHGAAGKLEFLFEKLIKGDT
jgi:colanic acid biosynthesis glycosyl transferase WcaI